MEEILVGALRLKVEVLDLNMLSINPDTSYILKLVECNSMFEKVSEKSIPQKDIWCLYIPVPMGHVDIFEKGKV